MSRIEKQPVNFPESVKVSLQDGEVLHIEGQKGELELSLIRQVEVKIEEDQVTINSTSKSKFSRAAAGTYRSLINNMVTGVTEGYSKELELVGVGYRAKSQGKTLNLTLGFSHPVNYEIPEGLLLRKQRNRFKNEILINGY